MQGFVVFLQHRSCGSWTCPAGLGWKKCLGMFESILGVPCGLELKFESLATESFSVGSTWCLKKLWMFRLATSKNKSSTFRLLFFTRFLAVCEIHSFRAVLVVILSQVQVCPLFAALGAFCHPQHIRNIHATWRVARPRNAVIYDVSRFFRAFSGSQSLKWSSTFFTFRE